MQGDSSHLKPLQGTGWAPLGAGPSGSGSVWSSGPQHCPGRSGQLAQAGPPCLWVSGQKTRSGPRGSVSGLVPSGDLFSSTAQTRAQEVQLSRGTLRGLCSSPLLCQPSSLWNLDGARRTVTLAAVSLVRCRVLRATIRPVPGHYVSSRSHYLKRHHKCRFTGGKTEALSVYPCMKLGGQVHRDTQTKGP